MPRSFAAFTAQSLAAPPMASRSPGLFAALRSKLRPLVRRAQAEPKPAGAPVLRVARSR